VAGVESTYKDEMKQTLEPLIRNDALSGKYVFAFGHCNATEEMNDYLAERGIRLNAILDNNEAKLGQNYHGTCIVSPEQIKEYADDETVVLVANRFYDQMAEQLRRLGYMGQIVKVVDFNSFSEFSLSPETIERKLARVHRGIEILKEIRQHYPAQHLVVCPFNALGDVYWAMAFLPGYLKKKDIGETAVVVTGNGCRQVAEMFAAENLTTLSRVEMDEFVQALIFTNEQNCIIAHHDKPYTDNIIRWLDKHFLSFIDFYRCAVYGLPPDTEPVKPVKSESFDNTVGMQKGSSVIIAPYAKSVTSPPASYWETLVKRYIQDGLMVYTSVLGDEKPIAGTQALTLPLNQMIAAVEFAGCFVGVRSGLCDIISSAECNKTVIFPDCAYSTTQWKVADFFALPGWEQVIFRDMSH
jgi:hypothetical protein